VTSLGIQLLLDGLPASVIDSLRADPAQLLPITGTVDLPSLATAPPLTFPSYSWYSYLGTDVIAAVQAVQTSAATELAGFAQDAIGTSVSISVPAPSTSTGGAATPTMMAGFMGAAGVAVGAAAVLL